MNRSRTHRFVLTLCSALLVAAATASAQDQQVNRADVAQSQSQFAPGSVGAGELDHAPPSPNDSDLGEQAILKRSDTYQPFSATAVVPCYWTSNVALSKTNEQDDFLVAPAVTLAYQPKFSPTFYGLVSVREQLFYYDEFDQLNFGDFNIAAGVVYIVPQWHNLILRLDFIYDRLTEKNSFESFFENYSVFLNAEIPFRIDRAQTLSLGIDANISIDANPEPPRRNDYEAYAAYTVSLTRNFSFDAVGRLIVHTYQLTDRVDVNEVLAGSANYRFNDYFTASAIGSFAANQSNHDVFDYKVGNLGGLLSLSVRF